MLLKPRTLLGLGMLALAAGSTHAATIQPAAVVQANGNGTVSNITITGTPGNDNVSGSNGNVQVNGKNFSANGPIDIVFTTLPTGGLTPVSEYFVGEGVSNSTGVTWTGYTLQLGVGFGGTFIPSPAGDNLDFDLPDLDPAPVSNAFSTVTPGEDLLTFGGGSVPTGQAVSFSFSIDVPDVIGTTFTLRQTPLVPEPTTLAAIVGAGAIAARRRRA